ncbi:peptidoglycan DD-metalloendopeptidase family protein [Candidatus Gracilibacteria bacterium]|nr:peptidoglycan DD-metalloendopeptidase family protein [Candidatus Gracilibacteria bacterium]
MVQFSYPIGWPAQTPGRGFFMRHGYAVENTWYNPNYWHTGEDWYALDGETAGAAVYAIAAGDVVYVGSDYPGRVVIVRHADDLFSMYGHLDPAVQVAVGEMVVRQQTLGTVLRRADNVPNHLHFELRTFYETAEVNGAQPRYPFRCGPNCAPGPGYWPIDAPDHPSDQGWRNPTHTINSRMLAPAAAASTVITTGWPDGALILREAPTTAAAIVGTLDVAADTRFTLLEVHVGAEDSRATGSTAYDLWYHLQLPAGSSGWAQAAVPSSFETGSDRAPSSIYFTLLPLPKP